MTEFAFKEFKNSKELVVGDLFQPHRDDSRIHKIVDITPLDMRIFVLTDHGDQFEFSILSPVKIFEEKSKRRFGKKTKERPQSL